MDYFITFLLFIYIFFFSTVFSQLLALNSASHSIDLIEFIDLSIFDRTYKTVYGRTVCFEDLLREVYA